MKKYLLAFIYIHMLLYLILKISQMYKKAEKIFKRTSMSASTSFGNYQPIVFHLYAPVILTLPGWIIPNQVPNPRIYSIYFV